MQEKSQGIILRVTRLTETSCIVRWWTMEHGLIETVAKGARGKKSAFSGKIDLFFTAQISWQRAKSTTLHYLKEILVEDYREGLRASYTHTLMAAYFCAWIEKISEPEHPDHESYDLLTRALNYLTTSPPSEKAMRHFERELARLHGVDHPVDSPLLQLTNLGAALPSMRRELLARLSGG